MAEKLARTTFETGIKDTLATVDVYTQTTAKDPIDALLNTVGIDIDDIGKLLGGLTGVPALLNDFFGNTELSSIAGGFINGIRADLNNALTEVSGNSAFVNSLSSVMKDVATNGVAKLTDFQNSLTGLQTVVFPANFEDKASLAAIGKYMLSSGATLNVKGTYAALQNSLRNHPEVLLEVTKSFLVTTAQTPNVDSLVSLSNGSLSNQLKTLNPTFISDFIGNFKLPVGATPAQYRELGATITSAFAKINPNWNKTLKADGTYSNDSTALLAASDDFALLMSAAAAAVAVPLASRTITNEQLIIPVGATEILFIYPAGSNISAYTYRDGIRLREIILADGSKITENTDSAQMRVTRVYAWSSTASTTVPTTTGSTFVSGPHTATVGNVATNGVVGVGGGAVGAGPFTPTTPVGTATSAAVSIPIASRTITREEFIIPANGNELSFVYPEGAVLTQPVFNGSIRTQTITLLDGTVINMVRDTFVDLFQIAKTSIIRTYVWSSPGAVSTQIQLPARSILEETFKLTSIGQVLDFVYPTSAIKSSSSTFGLRTTMSVRLIDTSEITVIYDYNKLEVNRVFAWRLSPGIVSVGGGGTNTLINIPLPARTIFTEKYSIPLGVTTLPFVYPADAVISQPYTTGGVNRQTVTLSDKSVIEIYYEYMTAVATRLFYWDTRTTNTITLNANAPGLYTPAAAYGLPNRSVTTEQHFVAMGVSDLPFVYPEGAITSATTNVSGLVNKTVTLLDGTRIEVSYNFSTFTITRTFIWSSSATATSSTVASGVVTIGGAPAVNSNQPTIPSGSTQSSDTQPPLIVRDGTSTYTSVGNYNAPDGSLFSILNPYTGGFTLVTENPGQSVTVTTSTPIALPVTTIAGDPLAATSLAISQNPLVLGAVINSYISQTESGNAYDPTPTLNASQALAYTFVDLP